MMTTDTTCSVCGWHDSTATLRPTALPGGGWTRLCQACANARERMGPDARRLERMAGADLWVGGRRVPAGAMVEVRLPIGGWHQATLIGADDRFAAFRLPGGAMVVVVPVTADVRVAPLPPAERKEVRAW